MATAFAHVPRLSIPSDGGDSPGLTNMDVAAYAIMSTSLIDVVLAR